MLRSIAGDGLVEVFKEGRAGKMLGVRKSSQPFSKGFISASLCVCTSYQFQLPGDGKGAMKKRGADYFD